MTSQTALAAAAALVALAFTLCLFERWLATRRRHDLAWALSLAMFTVGAGALWLGAAAGWNGPVFRTFYLFGAVLNVPFLALGTLYLLAGPGRADRWAAAVGLAAAFAAGVVLVAPFRGPVPPDRLPRGSEVFGALPRALAAVSSGAGALVVLGGAAVSAWRHRRGRDARRALVWANVLIAAGTLVLGGSGLLNSALGEMEAFALTLVIGVSFLFGGFLVASGARTGRAGGSRQQA